MRKFLAAVHFFDDFDDQCKITVKSAIRFAAQPAGPIGVLVFAFIANLMSQRLNIVVQTIALNRVDDINDFLQIKLNTAPILTRERAAAVLGTIHAVETDTLGDGLAVFFVIHTSPPGEVGFEGNQLSRVVGELCV